MAKNRASQIELDILKLCRKYARVLSKKFKIKKYRDVRLFGDDDPEKYSNYGMCLIDEGILLINIKNHNKSVCYGYDSIENILDTLVHEMAHLKSDGHGKVFYSEYSRMKYWFFDRYVYGK